VSRSRCFVAAIAAGVFVISAIVPWPVARAADEPKPVRSLTTLVSWCGSYSAIKAGRCVRVTTPEEWAALWAEHCGDKVERDSYNEVVVPQVDFRQCTIVAIFHGETVNTRSEQLVAVDEFEGEVRVRYEDRSYQTASAFPKETKLKPGETIDEAVKRSLNEGPKPGDPEWGGGNRTTPYGIFVLPHSDKPVVIERAQMTKQGLQGWEEQARLGEAR